MKKFVSVILCLLLVFSMGLNAFAISFEDVSPADPRSEAIAALGEAGLAYGRCEGEFKPNIAVTWVEALAFAVRASQYIKGEEVYGIDETAEPWYKPYIQYASENHIAANVPEDIGMLLTRNQVADMFANVMKSFLMQEINYVPSGYFTDFAEDDVRGYSAYYLIRAGVMEGKEERVFAPDELMSRGDLALMLARIVGLMPKLEISAHSPLYVEGVSVDDAIAYFAEVCLDTEFGDKTSGSLIRKWVEPFYYTVYGQPTDRDMEVLNRFVAEINSIENFPGMYPVESGADLEIYFYDQYNFEALMGSDFVGSWGGVTFWFDGLSQIYTETISIRTDIPQDARDSIIAEEIYNGIGPVQDTSLRDDSLICQWSNSNYDMTAVDRLILQLLYHPSIQTGMDYAQCEAVIRQLYY